jgi:hypothetical protein
MINEIATFKDQLTLKDLEDELLKLEQVEIPTMHSFMGGVYIREILIPKGTLIIGKRHRHETCNILLKGTLSIFMGKHLPVKTLTGPCIFPSEPGAKKMGYAQTDAVFANIHPTYETDLEKIEEEFIIPEEEYIESIKITETKKIEMEN